MRSELRGPRAAVLALVVLVLAALPGTFLVGPVWADDAAAVSVDDGVLRWGMSNEANNAAFAKGTSNFFSAGKIADPGKGNVALTRSGWKQTSGQVAIEKWNGTAYKAATWAGLGTDKDGVAITSPSSGRYSDHQFVFSGGTGTVDAASGTAHIAWTGDVTVLFYSGYTFFYLSDPVLDVADGHGTVTATLSGFGSTREDPDVWTSIPAQTVTVADLPTVDLGDEAGFNATPAYTGVTTTLDGVATTDSFPQSFVGFMNDLGTAPFWMKSGSSATDGAKKALPITVSYDASAPVDPTGPEEHTPAPVVDNYAPDPPKTVTHTITETITRTVQVPAAPVTAAPTVPVTAAPLTSSPVVELLAAEVPGNAPARDPTWAWWLGGGLLVAAALVVTGSLVAPAKNPSTAPRSEA